MFQIFRDKDAFIKQKKKIFEFKFTVITTSKVNSQRKQTIENK